ncbi:hypothetical protein NQ315_005604 [Exocentrus adspersus]|uniref:Srp40 C-terminal domain-containing protein n=1 Tax=Exocentrus adspersus TaxID=1586481 RepID=A0AAV8VUH2_9CUCU|nr:hypothetical protein NQ315_005604 [Exocentrus adspersus]
MLEVPGVKKAFYDLKHTRGKSFRHEKTKKKRGSYRGGTIDTSLKKLSFVLVLGSWSNIDACSEVLRNPSASSICKVIKFDGKTTHECDKFKCVIKHNPQQLQINYE